MPAFLPAPASPLLLFALDAARRSDHAQKHN